MTNLSRAPSHGLPSQTTKIMKSPREQGKDFNSKRGSRTSSNNNKMEQHNGAARNEN